LEQNKENGANVTKFWMVIATHEETILTKDVEIAKQKVAVKTYKVRLATKEETHKAKCHE
jgi:hypothetical protein